MNVVLKTFLWGIALCAGLAVGDVVADEIRESHKERKARKKKQVPPVVVSNDAPEVKVSNE